jgi:catechol 2,3-dioxygenase-like lactoylglutathione lyase family enzyme
MADVEVGGLHRTSSITKDAAKNAEFDAGVFGMRLLYRRVTFDDLSTYNLWPTPTVRAARAAKKGRPKRSWRRCATLEGVSQRKALCSSAAGHTFRRRGSK